MNAALLVNHAKGRRDGPAILRRENPGMAPPDFASESLEIDGPDRLIDDGVKLIAIETDIEKRDDVRVLNHADRASAIDEVRAIIGRTQPVRAKPTKHDRRSQRRMKSLVGNPTGAGPQFIDDGITGEV